MKLIAAPLALALPLTLTFSAVAQPAVADGEHAHVSAGVDSFQVGLNKTHTEHTGGPTKVASTKPATPPDAHDITMNICDINGVSSCGAKYACPDGSVMKVTYTYSDTGVVSNMRYSCPGPGLADIASAFKQVPMKASAIHVQPPHGETLVNFDSIFYTDPFTEDVTKYLLGVPVAFHITVQHYIWHFGDGTEMTTTDPGAAYPHQTLIHRYLKKGPVDVTLETVYQADYSIDGGPQTHLADTVTQTSPPQHLTILTATPHLVAD